MATIFIPDPRQFIPGFENGGRRVPTNGGTGGVTDPPPPNGNGVRRPPVVRADPPPDRVPVDPPTVRDPRPENPPGFDDAVPDPLGPGSQLDPGLPGQETFTLFCPTCGGGSDSRLQGSLPADVSRGGFNGNGAPSTNLLLGVGAAVIGVVGLAFFLGKP